MKAQDIDAAPAPRTIDILGLMTLIAAAMLFAALGWSRLGSIDLGYHIAYGRHFLDTGRIVEQDPFLYPGVALPFVNANWGSQIIMAAAERLGGAGGLIALRSILQVIVLLSIIAIVRRHAPGAHWSAWAIVLAIMAAYERLTLRPELFSYALMMALLVLLMRGISTWRGIVAIGLIQLAWVNCHSYFLVGLVLTGSMLIGQWITQRRTRAGEDAAISTNPARLLAIALAVQIAVCFVNPWLHRGAFFPFETLQYLRAARVMGGAEGWSGESAWSAISEFKSPFAFLSQPINLRTIHAYLVLLAVGLLGLPALLVRRQWGMVLAILILLAMSTQMRRNIAQFAMVAAPLLMIGLGGLTAWSPESLRAARQIRAVLCVVTLGLCAYWTFGIVEGRFYYKERRINRVFGTGYNDRVFAIDAATWIAERAEELKPNLYVNYFASSNTLPWLPPKFPIFVDTNTFAYHEDTLAMAYRLGLGQIDHTEFFDRFGVNVALLHCSSDTQMLVRRLAEDHTNWALVYFDRHTVIFVRRIVEHVKLILANRLGPASLDVRAWVDAIEGSPSQRALDIGIACGVPLSLGWHSKALELAGEATRLRPDYYEAWQYSAVCHGNTGNDAAKAGRYEESLEHYERALLCFEKVLTIVPDHQEALQYAKLTLDKMQQVEVRQAEKALVPDEP